MTTQTEAAAPITEVDPPAPPHRVGGRRLALGVGALGMGLVLVGAGLAVAGRDGGASATLAAGENVAVTGTASPIDAFNSPAVAVDPTDARTLVVSARKDRPNFSATVQVSRDAGATWVEAPLVVPEGRDRPFAPDVAFDADGRLYVAFVTLEGEGNNPGAVWIESSTDRGATFSPPVQVAGPHAYQVRLAVNPRSGALHLTWVQSTAEATSRLNALGNPPNPVVMVTSEDRGTTFGSPVQVSEPTRLRVGAATPVVADDDRVHVLYEDFGDDERDFGGLEGPVYDGLFSLILATSSDGGKTFGQGVVVEPAVVPTERFLVYLPKFPSIALDADRIYVAWADGRSGDGDSDVFLRRSDDGGRTFTSPRRVTDDDESRQDQLLPRVGVSSDGRVDVLYLDRRADGNNILATATLATSFDGGDSFTTVVVSDSSFDSRVGPGSERGAGDLGSRLALVSRPATVHAVWTDTRNGTLDTDKQDIYSAAVTVRRG